MRELNTMNVLVIKAITLVEICDIHVSVTMCGTGITRLWKAITFFLLLTGKEQEFILIWYMIAFLNDAESMPSGKVLHFQTMYSNISYVPQCAVVVDTPETNRD